MTTVIGLTAAGAFIAVIIIIMIHHGLTHPELPFPSNFFDPQDALDFINAAAKSHEAIILIMIIMIIGALLL